MTRSGQYHPVIDRACSTDPGSEASRKEALDEIVAAVNGKRLPIADLAVLLAGPLTSPEKEARENGTRLLGEVVGRCRGVLGEGELHTLAEFLAARLRDWPCVGAAATACRSLLQRAPGGGVSGSGDSSGAGGDGDGGRPSQLRDESAALVLEATAEVLRSSQSFRQDDRSALLQLLLAVARGWGGVASGRGVPLLDAFLGAADGEKDPRCLMVAFEAVRALCEMHHVPGVDAAPLRQLADEVADWASSYFPVSFNPPPSLARGPSAITRADLAASLECALAASPFLAGAVLPLLVEKLSSTYRPAKEDSLSALRRCCPAFGPDALAPHLGQLWPALRAEVMAPGGSGGAAASAAGPMAAGGGGADVNSGLALAANAAGCLTVVVRAAGPGGLDALALQDACVGDVLAMLRSAGSPTRGSSVQAVARADGQVQCGAMVLAAIAAAGPASLERVHTSALVGVQTALGESMAWADPYDVRADQTLYGMTVLAAVVDAVAAELRPVRGAVDGDGGAGGGDADSPAAAAAAARAWLLPGAARGLAALVEVKGALLAAVAALHTRLHPLEGGTAEQQQLLQQSTPPDCYSPAAAAQLRLGVVGVWSALLRMHAAAAAAAASASASGSAGTQVAGALGQLTLTADELRAAAEQLCAAALRGGAAAPSSAGGQPTGGGGGTGAQMKARMRWGRLVDATAEETAALQLLLQLQPLATDGSDGSGGGEGDAVLGLLVERLTAAMADGAGSAADVRAAALRLAVRLTEAPAAGQRSASAGGPAARAAAFVAELLVKLQPLLLRKGSGGISDEEWLLDCLKQLATQVLPRLAPGAPPARGPPQDTTSPSAASPPPLPPGAVSEPPQPPLAATAAAARSLVAAALQAAADWEAAGGAEGVCETGLPFGQAAVQPDESGQAGEVEVTHGSVPVLPPPDSPLMTAWCAAVQQLTACCDDMQQLELAMEAAERIAACCAWLADARDVTAATAAAAAAATGPRGCPALAASVPLACAVVAGLRVGVLAPHSTQALADNLLRLLLTATAAAVAAPSAAPEPAGVADPATACRMDHALKTAAVALAAAVNRWPDAASLDSWLASAFRPALSEPLREAGAGAAGAGAGAASSPSAAVVMDAAAAGPGTPAPAMAAVAATAAVRAVGWVGRALALRNHPALQEVVEVLLVRLRAEPDPAGCGAGAAAAEAAAAMDVDAGVEAGVEAGAVAVDSDVEMKPAGASHGSGLGGGAPADEQQPGYSGGGAAATAPAAAAADSFGVLVAEAASSGGVALVARPPQAVCRVLWQQRTYSLCVQALDAEYQQQRQQRQQSLGPAAALRMPTQMALAVARLAGSAPRHVCRADAGRLAPLLLRSVQALCGALRGGSDPRVGALLAPVSAEAAAGALQEALNVLRDWLSVAKDLPSEQLEKVLQDNVEEFVGCVCEAAQIGAGNPLRGPRTALGAATAIAAAAVAAAPLNAAVAAAIREEALQCCSGLIDALPYHVLHPLRQQVLSCIARALDDNRRSVRQLAVRARRAWGDT